MSESLRNAPTASGENRTNPSQSPTFTRTRTALSIIGPTGHQEPIKGEINQLREYYSQRDAIREHGAEKVKAAYDALANGLNARDPEVVAVYQRAMASIDPYGDIMKWHKKQTIFSTIGDDPESVCRAPDRGTVERPDLSGEKFWSAFEAPPVPSFDSDTALHRLIAPRQPQHSAATRTTATRGATAICSAPITRPTQLRKHPPS